jgi:signal transduction histidine kinase
LKLAALTTFLTKNYVAFVVMLLVIFGVSLAWFDGRSTNDFREYHLSLAKESTSGVAEQVAHFVAEQNRLVSLFAEEHLELILRVKNDPENDEVRLELGARIKLYFPNHFAFTLASAEGEPLYEDFDGLVSNACTMDIKSYVANNMYEPYIHPNSESYHFDVMANFGKEEGNKGIFFISFHADVMGNILKSSQVSNHSIMLVYAKRENLIEVITDGARNHWERMDYRLTESEQARILHKVPIKGTRWEATDLHEPSLFSQFEKELQTKSALIFILIFVICAIFVKRLYREERHRESVEAQKSALMGVITHEFRTPITAALGALGLLKGNTISAELNDIAKGMVDISLNNVRRLKYLANDFLDLQKIESDRLDVDMKNINLISVVQKAVADNELYGKKFGVNYIFETEKEEARVFGDEHRLEQVMANFLSNAAKYGSKNSDVEITINTSKSKVRIMVSDHGPGIPKGFQGKVFEKFSMAGKQHVGEVSSTGLGLSIAKAIIEQHGGRIGFNTRTDAQSDTGTTFWFEIPAANKK